MTFPAMLACLLLQNTWIVDDTSGPGVDFPDLPPAVAAAADGDILLVSPGTYSHFTLTGKGLRIFGSGASSTIVSDSNPATLAPGTAVADLPPGSVAHVEGLRFTGSFTVSGGATQATLADVEVYGPYSTAPNSLLTPALHVNGALVEIARSLIVGGSGFGFGCGFIVACSPPGGVGLSATNGALVHVASSVVLGGNGSNVTAFGGSPGGLGAPGVWASASQVWIADSTIRGGHGGCTTGGGCNAGGAGVFANGGFVRISGDSTSLVQGGNMGGGAPYSPGPGISATGSVVVVHSVPVLAGVCRPSCIPVPAVVGSAVTLNAPPLPVLEVSGTLTTTGTATITLSNGLPNAAFVIALAAAPGFVPGGTFFLGEILLDPVNWYVLAIGSLTPAGDVSLTLPLTAIPPGFVHLPVLLQGLAFDPAGFWRLSNATVATIRP
ncbi:MAG: hypothetical protein L0323_06425 [Planctomycetes bacterium]|nr:hypothetical protein [Planctomycetota bacterium]